MENPFDISGKKILITGASSGIGRAIAKVLARQNASLFLSGRNLKHLEETRSLCNGTHQIITADLGNITDIVNLVNQVEVLNGLVFSTGINKRLPLKLISKEATESVINVNSSALIYLTSNLLKHKKIKEGSSIVVISSVAARYSSLGNILYMASKGALEAALRGMALELAHYKIRMNSIKPGMIMTHLTSVLDQEMIENDMKKYPLGRYGKPEDVAYLALYLLSDASQWMTGSSITLDGGLTLQ